MSSKVSNLLSDIELSYGEGTDEPKKEDSLAYVRSRIESYSDIDKLNSLKGVLGLHYLQYYTLYYVVRRYVNYGVDVGVGDINNKYTQRGDNRTVIRGYLREFSRQGILEGRVRWRPTMVGIELIAKCMYEAEKKSE